MSIISELHKKLWKVGMGSVSASEGEFLSREIVARKPKTFVEIGTATGL
jgi:predicted O-methyltransferase YrrM